MSDKVIRYIQLPNGDVVQNAGPQYAICRTGATYQTKTIELEHLTPTYTGLPLGFTVNVLMENGQNYGGCPELKINVTYNNQTIQFVKAPIYTAQGVPASSNAWVAGDLLTFVFDTEVVPGEIEEINVFRIVNSSFKDIFFNGYRFRAGDPYSPSLYFNNTYFSLVAEETVPEPPETKSYLGNVIVDLNVATTSETSTYLNIS